MKKINPLKRLSFEDLIVHEDKDFIVINKPPFISTLEDRRDPFNILQMARAYEPRAQVCHRLDKETSGLLVISKREEAYKYFARMLESREVHKLYHTLIAGRVELDEQEIDAPIYTTSNRSRIDHGEGKASLTLVSTLHIYKAHTLVACMPFTGRMHQIRVHMAYLGHPLIGDNMYGGPQLYLSEIKPKFKMAKFQEEKPLISRMALHAQGLTFPSIQGQTLKLLAPYPKDFAAVLNQLGKNK
ncbi:MAG: RluA family pseudouridine synthase [Bacteroidota bacterium]